MKYRLMFYGLLLTITAGYSTTVSAHGGEDHHAQAASHGDTGHDMALMSPMFSDQKVIDGYTVRFSIMKAKKEAPHDGAHQMPHTDTHHLMVKIEKNGVALTDILINSKVVHPDGTTENKMLMPMNGGYMTGYDFTHAGEHQIMVLFKTDDGEKHFGGIRYTALEGK